MFGWEKPVKPKNRILSLFQALTGWEENRQVHAWYSEAIRNYGTDHKPP